MPTLMLSPGNVSVTKFQPLLRNSSKPLIFTSPSSFHSHKHKQKQKQIHSYQTLGSISSRHSSGLLRDAYKNEELIGCSPQASTSRACDTPEMDPFYCVSYKTTPGAVHISHGSGDKDTCPDRISSNCENSMCASFSSEDASASLMPSLSWLKFPLLLGLPTLLDSQQAIAGSELTAGIQSVPYFGDLGDISTGFASAFLLIFFSELGDKTFFIAAILAARNSGAVIFLGTFGALAAMTIVSVALGRTFHYVDDILPFRFGETDLPLDDIAAVGLLVYFGVTTLIEAASSDGQKTEDEQKEAEIAVSEFSGDGAGLLAAANTVFSTFLVVFVAEWGDKSFFSTIALAAASSPLGVIGGALAGHAVATLLAVLGGSLLGTFLSEKAVAYVGGTLFLVFAAVTLFEIVT